MLNTWNGLLSAIKQYKSEFPEKTEFWFRGQCDSEYVLLPSLFRFPKGMEKEKEVFDTFKRLSQKIAFSHKNEWELLIDMQHYFIPTRLLDWSENLGIAIYFAIYSHTNNKDISLYVLNPLELNKYSKKQGIPIVPDDNMGLSYINNYIKKEPFPPTYPIAIKSNFINERVMAQRGMFTVHGDDLTAIEKLCPNAVEKFIISYKAIPEIKEFLDIANINEFTVFPDLHGLSYFIRNLLL